MTIVMQSSPHIIDAAFVALEQISRERGLSISRQPDQVDGYLEVRIQGAQHSWEFSVECAIKYATRLPNIALRGNSRYLAHVGYDGGICVTDNQGLSLDLERPSEIVAYTVLSAFDLLEKWGCSEEANTNEFYNELEGYWQGLPGAEQARSKVEVDGKDRMLLAYLTPAASLKGWSLIERNENSLSLLKQKGITPYRALYLHMQEPIAPPIKPARLDANIVEGVRQKFTPEQTVLWNRFMEASKNAPNKRLLMISVPRMAGGLSLIGIVFDAKAGKIDKSLPVIPISVRRFTASYMRERGGASLELLDKHVVIIGCGAVGSVVADSLSAVGVGRITLVDGDTYSEDNVFRHIIDPDLIEFNKVIGLGFELKRHYPGIQVSEFPGWAQEWLKTADFSKVDGVVFALGLPTLERILCRQIRSQSKRALPILFTWLEPLDIGGHSVVCWTEHPGCLDCLFRDDEGQASLQARTAFLEPNQVVTRNLTGCSSIFVPYSALQSRRTGLMAAEHLLVAMKSPGFSYRYWIGEGSVAAEKGFRTTPWRDTAKSLNFDQATQQVFGRACKHCRGAK